MGGILFGANKKELKQTIDQFKTKHPDLIKRGISYEPYDNMSIVVRIPCEGKLIYELFGDRITWLERWPDEKSIKMKDREMRQKDYTYFCFAVKQYMRDNHMSQQAFADIVGISRHSLSYYLNGRLIPKTNTMRRILKVIEKDIKRGE